MKLFPKDITGRHFYVGQKAVRSNSAGKVGPQDGIHIVDITRVCEGKVYINNSKHPLLYPERLAIIDQSAATNAFEGGFY